MKNRSTVGTSRNPADAASTTSRSRLNSGICNRSCNMRTKGFGGSKRTCTGSNSRGRSSSNCCRGSQRGSCCMGSRSRASIYNSCSIFDRTNNRPSNPNPDSTDKTKDGTSADTTSTHSCYTDSGRTQSFELCTTKEKSKRGNSKACTKATSLKNGYV